MTATSRAAPGAARLTVVAWAAIIPALAGILFGFWIGAQARSQAAHAAHVHPAPWSCASELAKIAPVDGSGQIAPVCGATPYPDTP
jgi:hypothetical protein